MKLNHLLGATALAVLPMTAVVAQGTTEVPPCENCADSMTISSWGGAYQAMQQKAYAEPYAAATGVNLWAEWAKIEIAGEYGAYSVPAYDARSAGPLLSLARQEQPDTSAYNDPEIVYRVDRPHHAGLIVGRPSRAPASRSGNSSGVQATTVAPSATSAAASWWS